LGKLEDITGQKIEYLHIVGGGSQNRLLNQLCADVTGCKVIAGPTEVTSMGNILVQWLSRGKISSITEGRKIVQESFNIQTYLPQTVPDFGRIYERFLSLKPNG
jgi:rhamnulokinase